MPKSSKKKKVISESESSKEVKKLKREDGNKLLNPSFWDEKLKANVTLAFRNHETFETSARRIKTNGTPQIEKKNISFDTCKLQKEYRRKTDNGDVVIHSTPFTCCVLQNFISDELFLENLKGELLDLDFREKSNDLYKFHQSNDLRTTLKYHSSTLRELLYGTFRQWLQNVTGITLSDQVDMSCAQYQHTDVLLCHDDELEGRRIAYILYLVPPWTSEDGGTLDLFSVDEHGQPDSIELSLVPKWNSLVFFEVSPVSFHQVSEVLSLEKTRLSVSGWFHGDPVKRPIPYKESPSSTAQPLRKEDELLIEWINPMYLDEGIVSEIRGRFEDESEMELQDFLLEVKYSEVLKALRDTDVVWEARGPANKRQYSQARTEHEQFPPILKQLMELLQSQPFFKLLRMFTGLELADVPLKESDDEEIDKKNEDNEESSAAGTETDVTLEQGGSSNHCCHGELRHWKHGSYTLVHDTDPVETQYALDTMLYCGCEGWTPEQGGFTSYVARGEDEELLTVSPLENSFALVYRDKETIKFVKHVNHNSVMRAGSVGVTNGFYDFYTVYYE